VLVSSAADAGGRPAEHGGERVKTPREMSKRDYEDLGFMCGLEVHQQLRTREKLFCHCPNTRYSQTYDAELLRHMRPTLSELGEYDPTALMEFKTRKEIVYRISRSTVCTYEMDDCPPFPINEEALDIALEMTLLLGCNLVSELHVSRKQYLDGSIPAGFQRTTILGINGSIPFRGRRIGIRQLGLEEDSCREVSDAGRRRTFLTDRLSIPLIETVTEPEMRTPEEAAAVGQVLRSLARSTGKVKTGTGSGRQDVNVSIRGGTRIEIKGVNRIPMIPALTHYEAMRQKALIEIAGALARRGINAAAIGSTVADVTALARRTHFAPLQGAISMGQRVLAIRLPGFKDVLNGQIGPRAKFAREFSCRVRVIACLDRMPNIAYSDSPEPTLANRLWERVIREVGASPEDAVVLVWGPEKDAQTAASEVLTRAREATMGVPKETRKALHDGTTLFERVLPGPDRMYPDTDLPPFAVTQERLDRVRRRLEPPPWEFVERYVQQGVPRKLASQMASDPRRTAFEWLLGLPGADPRLACRVVGQTIRSLRRKGVPVDRVSDGNIVGLFRMLQEGRFARDALPDLLADLASNPAATPESVVSKLIPDTSRKPDVGATVGSLLSGDDWRRDGDERKEMLIAMGLVMPHLGKFYAGAEVAQRVREHIETRRKSP